MKWMLESEERDWRFLEVYSHRQLCYNRPKPICLESKTLLYCPPILTSLLADFFFFFFDLPLNQILTYPQEKAVCLPYPFFFDSLVPLLLSTLLNTTGSRQQN